MALSIKERVMALSVDLAELAKDMRAAGDPDADAIEALERQAVTIAARSGRVKACPDEAPALEAPESLPRCPIAILHHVPLFPQ